MKTLLIIRSASMQQLDKNLVEIEKRFSDYEIHMLTHEHSIKLVEKYKSIKQIYVYPYKSGFSAGNKVDELRGKEFDAVLIPVTNITGAGFFNVLRFSFMLRAKQRFICNLISDIWEVTSGEIRWMGIKNVLMSIASAILAGIAGIFVLLVLPWKLKQIEKKGE
ncbi:hypothetical protein P4S95_11435 [Aneurinibacillus aneurinilyticus]|uniref:hypothetical protein n=1 Tax=Aneurinibacillus aneurinilyticus TaxID=1391 RepID=UPI002E20ED10|nr:hypothetical protein [Aneurinibacillus aneurinilyticus]